MAAAYSAISGCQESEQETAGMLIEQRSIENGLSVDDQTYSDVPFVCPDEESEPASPLELRAAPSGDRAISVSLAGGESEVVWKIVVEQSGWPSVEKTTAARYAFGAAHEIIEISDLHSASDGHIIVHARSGGRSSPAEVLSVVRGSIIPPGQLKIEDSEQAVFREVLNRAPSVPGETNE